MGRGGGEERDDRVAAAHFVVGWLPLLAFVFAFGGADGASFCRVTIICYRWAAARALSLICIDLAALSVLKVGQVASQELVERLLGWATDTRPSTHLRLRPKARTGTDASSRPRLGAKQTTLLARGGLADAR